MSNKLNVVIVSAKDLQPGMNLVNIGVIKSVSEFANVIIVSIDNPCYVQTDLKTLHYLPFEPIIIYKKSQ